MVLSMGSCEEFSPSGISLFTEIPSPIIVQTTFQSKNARIFDTFWAYSKKIRHEETENYFHVLHIISNFYILHVSIDGSCPAKPTN